jgi:hypothetical protein
MAKIKLVVVNEHTLAFITPELPTFGQILHASILKGATFCLHPDRIYTDGASVRLASEKDFNDFRVCFNGFNNDKVYEFSKD